MKINGLTRLSDTGETMYHIGDCNGVTQYVLFVKNTGLV
ncbi:hypothetical protein JOD25_002976 [Kurthia huakuii]|nr:hypothetical protein [Kurthia huakuii]